MQYVTAVTLGAAMVLTQAFVPGMRAAKFGRIVNISSRAIQGKTSRTVYASAKAGLIGMTRTIACEVGGDGITVNTVIPGPVASDLFTRGHPLGSAKRQTVIDAILVKRVGTPDVTSPGGALLSSTHCNSITAKPCNQKAAAS